MKSKIYREDTEWKIMNERLDHLRGHREERLERREGDVGPS